MIQEQFVGQLTMIYHANGRCYFGLPARPIRRAQLVDFQSYVQESRNQSPKSRRR